MSEPRLIASKSELPIEEISSHDRLRPVGEAGVATILASIREIGQLTNPVVVRQLWRQGEQQYRVLDGAHRLEAARQLGWGMVPVRVFECTDDQARIMEIDGNLSGAELNPLDTAVFLATRKAVYERLHPEAAYATGGALALKRWDAKDTMSVASFVTTTAAKFGLSERHVRRMAAAGDRLHPDEITTLRAAPKPVTLKDLQVIAKANTTDRYFIVDLLSKGEAKSAADAIKRSLGAPKLTDAQQKMSGLIGAWSRASIEVRREFVQARWAEMTGLLRDAEPADTEPGDADE